MKTSKTITADHAFVGHGGVLRVAHRGGGGLRPENTMCAFEHAAELGVDAIELDVHATKDGQLVVMHDDTVDRTTNGSGAVRGMVLAELKEFDAGYGWTDDGGSTFPHRGRGITIPTLTEALEAFEGMRFVVELKPDDPVIAGHVSKVIDECAAAGRVLVGSFSTAVVKAFRRVSRKVPTAAGESEVRVFYCLTRMYLGGLYAPAAAALVVPEWNGSVHVVTPRTVAAAHRHGIKVYVWTVNERNAMDRLIEWGADGIISDYPDRLPPSSKR